MKNFNKLLVFGLIVFTGFLFGTNVNGQTISPDRYWTFNGSNAATDSMGAGNLNFSTYGGQYVVESNGRVGNYITLNGSSALITGGQLPVNEYLTAEFLFKPGDGFNTTKLLSRADGAFMIQFTSEKIYFATSYKSTTGTSIFDNFEIELNGLGRKTYGYYVDGDWHHLVFVFNGNTGEKQIWVDGQLPDGFSKTITKGHFDNSGNTLLYLNHNVSYVKYFGSIDEVAIYTNPTPDKYIYKHYLEFQAGTPYNFTNNYNQSLPVADPVAGPLDMNEFPPGHPNVTISAVDQMKKFPAPRYKQGHTLLENYNWMDPKYMGGINQPGVTFAQAAVNSVAIQTELAKYFNYYFHVSLGNSTYENAWVDAANANPDFKLSLTLLRVQLNGNNSEVWNQNKPASHYLQNSSGQFIDINGNVTTNKIWRPTAPISSYTDDGYNMLARINDLFTRLNRPIDIVNENGELFPNITNAAMAKDPAVTADKNASGLDWETYLAKRVMENETQAYRNIIMSHPMLANAKFTEYGIDGQPTYNYKYSEIRKINYTINGQYYATSDFYPRWPSNWRNWVSSWHGWQWMVESRNYELAVGDRLYSPFVAAGWSMDEEVNIRPAQWLGLLKCLNMTGAEFFYTGHFTEVVPGPKPENWIWQAVMPSYAQAVTSRYEQYLRNGELMDGDIPNNYITPTGPGYTFKCGDQRKLIVIRKLNGSPKYAITGTVQPNSNMMGNAENESVAKITLDNQELKFKVRRQGSTYIYDNTNPSNPVFYQLDKWHEKSHPYRWSSDFNFEAELYDNTNSQVSIKTSRPAGAAQGDFSEFTSYISWPANTQNPAPVEYNFTPRNTSNNTYYLWVKARSKDGVTTSLNVQIDNNTAKSIGCISDTNWTWYRYDACDQLPIIFQNITNQDHLIRITPSNDKLEIDEILLSVNSNLILNSAPPACGTATATITSNGNTTFCQGGSVLLTASTGTSYLWSPGGQTTQSITVTNSGTYNVSVGTSGCMAIATPVDVVVQQNPIATITPSGSTSICQGSSVTLSAPAGAASYLWLPGGLTTQSINATIAGNYTVKVTNSGGCSQTSSPVSVTVNQVPVANVNTSGPTSFCAGGNVTLSTSGGTSYLWFPGGETTASINVNSTGTYSVQVSNGSNCSATSTPVNVDVLSNPVATISNSGSSNLCNGESATLSASSGSSYLWSNGATTQSINASASGQYSVTVYAANGCSSSSNPEVITVAPPVNASISANGSTILQAGQSVTLSASGGVTYKWSPGGATTQSIVVSTAGDYYVTAYDANGCSGNSSIITVTVNSIPPPPPATISSSNGTSLCPGENLVLTASVGLSYLWLPGGETTQSITVTNPGTYTVTVADTAGIGTTDAYIEIDLNPVPGTPSILTSYIPNSAFQLTAYDPAAYSYIWSNGSTSESIIVNSPGTYTVTALSEAGCASHPETMIINSTAPQSCVSPDMLSNYNITFEEATLSWNPAITADSFLVEYTRISDNTTSNIYVPGNTSEVTLTDLVQGEQYKWIVFAVCGVNQNGSSIKQFETLSGPLPCGSTPQGTDVLLVNSTFARVTWLPAAADNYVIRYREVGTSNYKHKRINAISIEKMIFGLTPSTTYEWSIKSICNGSSSLYSTLNYFTTLDVCPSIGNVTVTETGFNTAQLSWNSGVLVDTLMIRYEVAGSNELTVIKIVGDPNPGNFMLTGLQPETTYNAWVSTKCSSGSTSMWGSGVSFTTGTEPTVRNAAESGIMHLNAYPNPAKHQINYVFESYSTRPYTVKVSDMAGKVLFSETRIPNEGLTGEKVPLAGFASGMYMLIVQQGPVIGRFRFNVHE